MDSKKLNYILGILLIISVCFSGFLYGKESKLGIKANATKFTNLEVTNELQTADLTVTDDVTIADDVAVTGDLAVTGDTTLGSGYIKTTGSLIEQSVSSTLKVGNDASGLNTGCLVLGDSAGVTSSPVYITATGATISATTTKPAICR